MYTFRRCQEIVQHALKQEHLLKEPNNLYEPVHYTLSLGGKRIRPVLVLMGCNVFSDTIDHAIHPALGTEIFHNFTLIHDDIMDHSQMRRNNPTVHVKWDLNTAVLSGDIMCIMAYDYLLNVTGKFLKPVLQTFNIVAHHVCEGQQLDLDFAHRNNVTETDYLDMIEKKTASLIGGCLKIGAILGEASRINADYLYKFGINLGIAFQLQDDLLDVYGTPGQFGKQVGSDIIEHKKTYLLIKAFELAPSSVRERLNTLLFYTSMSSSKQIEEVIHIYDELNIKAITEEAISSYFRQAKSFLSEISIDNTRKLELESMVEWLLNRNY